MFKFSKVILSFIIMVGLFHSTSYAASSEASDNFTLMVQSVSNEYDTYKNLKNKSNNELTRLGYSTQNINYINNFNYDEKMQEKVVKLKSNSEKTLYAKGYSKEQISAIYNYQGTELQKNLLAAQLTLSTFSGPKEQTATFSYINFRTNFSWSSEPFFIFDDILAVAWSEDMYLDTNKSNSFAVVNYISEITGEWVSSNNPSVTPELNKGAYIKFSMTKPAGLTMSYAQNGRFFYRLTKKDRVKEVAVQPTYGHTVVKIGSPSVSFPLGVGVSFSWQVVEEASNYLYVEL